MAPHGMFSCLPVVSSDVHQSVHVCEPNKMVELQTGESEYNLENDGLFEVNDEKVFKLWNRAGIDEPWLFGVVQKM